MSRFCQGQGVIFVKNGLNILVVGGGGREHALVWKLAKSPLAKRVFVAPGNAGTMREPKTENVPLQADDVSALLAFAQERTVDLTVVGPEIPLALGIVDRFQEKGLAIFGPRQVAARLESSKAFSKCFMHKNHIPCAASATFEDAGEAMAYASRRALPLVIKADGLAAGKGVVVARDHAEAQWAINAMLTVGIHGEAGKKILLEEFLPGREASFICMVDGTRFLPLASACDYKARDDNGHGPNTGGMGACSPAPFMDSELQSKVIKQIVTPTLEGMEREGSPFSGFLYVGLMIDEHKNPGVLEFNCRLGDPETQPIFMRMHDDFLELLLAFAEEASPKVDWDERVAVGVVMASQGYPGEYLRGKKIRMPTESNSEDSVKVFHAGTQEGSDGHVVATGGRVLCVTALGVDYDSGRQRAYQCCEKNRWEGAFYRKDIASF